MLAGMPASANARDTAAVNPTAVRLEWTASVIARNGPAPRSPARSASNARNDRRGPLVLGERPERDAGGKFAGRAQHAEEELAVAEFRTHPGDQSPGIGLAVHVSRVLVRRRRRTPPVRAHPGRRDPGEEPEKAAG
mgnify:CR=1 FL=1